jgi:PAS domain S-box-containing protein
MKFQISITLKLVGFMLVVSVLPLLLLQMVSYRAVLQMRMDVAKAHNEQLLEVQIEYLTLQTDQIESLAENPAWAKEIERLPVASGSYDGIQASYDALTSKTRIGQLLSGYSNMNGLESIDLYNANGAHHHVGENHSAWHEDGTELAHQMLRASESRGQTVWLHVGGDGPGPTVKSPKYIAIKSIYKSGVGDSKPELLGMLRVNLSVEFLSNHFSALNLGDGAYLMLVGNQGKMVYHPNRKLIGQPLPSNFAQALLGPSGSFLTDQGGEQVLLSHLQVPDKKWTLLSVVPRSTLTAPLLPIQRTNIAVLIICLLVIAWFTRMYLHRVVYPIRDVSNGFRDFQTNKLAPEWRLPQPKAWIQIGDLVGWFNSFLDSAQLQRQSAQELQASESRNRGLISAIPDLIFMNRRDGTFLDVHAGNAALLLYAPEDIRNRTIAELLPAPIAQQFMSTIGRALDSGELQELNYSLQIDGIDLQFEARFAAAGEESVISIVRDITARTRMEEAQRVAAIAFESELGMIVTDAERTILRINKTFTRITGYSAEDAVGRTPRLHSSGHQSAAFYDAMNQCIQREGSWQGEVWNRRKNGEIYPVWLSITTVKDDDGNITNYVGSHHDISDLKSAEDALHKLNHELSESRGNLRAMASQQEVRLEREKKHIAREVHDELGQVLTALRMHLSMCVKDHGGLAPGLAVELQDMKKLVDQAIVGVRNVAANLRPTALDMGLVAAIEWLGAEFSKRTLVPCSISVHTEVIEVDEIRAVVFFRIVQESLTNIARHAQATQVDIHLVSRGDALRLEVRDNGRGFLVSSKGNRKTFGLLGMRERSLSLGGTLDINSTPGLGTVVVVLIPLNETATENIVS